MNGKENTEKPPQPTSFQEDLRSLINRHSVECQSDTPDYILAQFLLGALNSFNDATIARDKSQGRDPL